MRRLAGFRYERTHVSAAAEPRKGFWATSVWLVEPPAVIGNNDAHQRHD
jgi:hypothetical protein